MLNKVNEDSIGEIVDNPVKYITEMLKSQEEQKTKRTKKRKKQELIEEEENYSLSSYEQKQLLKKTNYAKIKKISNKSKIPISKNLNHKSIYFKNIKENNDNYKIKILFPFKPYKTQKEYMKTLLKAYSNKKNAILESPTGTGKTLVLLTTSLAFLKKEREKGNFKIKILYFSRTHFQLKQVIDELKNSGYRPKMSVLGSRDHLCSNFELKNLKGFEKTNKCEELVRNDNCQFYKNFSKNKILKSDDIFNIEEIVKRGNKKKICSFYHAKQNTDTDIIFLPYNYCFNYDYRNSHKELFKNSILIFDEAHNIQSVAEDGCSFSLDIEDLTNIIGAFKKLGKYDLKHLHLAFEELLNIMKNLKKNLLAKYKQKKKDFNKVFPGKDLFYILEENSKDHKKNIKGINSENIKTLKNNLKKILKDTEKLIKPKNLLSIEKLKKFLSIISNLWKDLSENTSNSKKIYNFKLNIEKKKKNIFFNLWCLSASFAFKEIQKLTPHSIILTSGTLSPIKNFKNEIGINFDFVYKGNHVINTEKQLFKCILSQFGDNNPIDLSYSNRGNLEMISFIGESILDICEIIPEGVLVFFPSYAVMNNYCDIWEREVFFKIKCFKKIFIEVKGSENNRLIRNYEISHKSGAIFFAVCNGKLSEGVDFTDSMARCSIVVGIPFSNCKDLKLIAKRDFLNINKTDSYDGQEWYKNKALRATNQAIGRVIRHKNDYGAIIFFDRRFDYQGNKKYISSWVNKDLRQCENYKVFLNNLSSFFKEIKNEFEKITDVNEIENYFCNKEIDLQKNQRVDYFNNFSSSYNNNYSQNIGNNYSQNNYNSSNKKNTNNKYINFLRKYNSKFSNNLQNNENIIPDNNVFDSTTNYQNYTKNKKYFSNINENYNSLNKKSSSEFNNKNINTIITNSNLKKNEIFQISNIKKNENNEVLEELNEDEIKNLLGSLFSSAKKSSHDKDDKNNIDINTYSIFSQKKKISFKKKKLKKKFKNS